MLVNHISVLQGSHDAFTDIWGKNGRQTEMMQKVWRLLLFISRHQLQVVGGCHIVMSLQLQLHSLRDLSY